MKTLEDLALAHRRLPNLAKAFAVVDSVTNKQAVAKAALCAELCGNRELGNMLRLLSDHWMTWGHLTGAAQRDAIYALIG